jgi:hypothetical protein
LLENTMLRQIDAMSIRDRASVFRRCDFTKAKWRGTLGLDGARYEQVSFRGADLRRILCYQGYFVDCDFSDAKLKGVDFNASHFVRCTFKGKLEDVWFRSSYIYPSDVQEYGETEPNPMEDVDFVEAELWDVYFAGCDLSTVMLPQDGNHVLLSDLSRSMAKAEHIVRNEWTGLFREQALDCLRLLGGSKGPMVIVNLAFQAELARMNFPDQDQIDEFLDAFLGLLRQVAQHDN